MYLYGTVCVCVSVPLSMLVVCMCVCSQVYKAVTYWKSITVFLICCSEGLYWSRPTHCSSPTWLQNLLALSFLHLPCKLNTIYTLWCVTVRVSAALCVEVSVCLIMSADMHASGNTGVGMATFALCVWVFACMCVRIVLVAWWKALKWYYRLSDWIHSPLM